MIDGAVSGRLLVKSGGVYTVTATNNNLVSPPSAALTITVDVPLVKPVITLTKGQLQSSVAAGNQWYLDGLAIPGAVGMLYQPTAEGHYTVRDSLGACISPLSDAYTFKIDAVIRLDDTHYLTSGRIHSGIRSCSGSTSKVTPVYPCGSSICRDGCVIAAIS